MIFLIYLIIGIIFSFVYTLINVKQNKALYKEKGATADQIKRIYKITFIIVIVIYPITIIELIVKAFIKFIKSIKKGEKII